MEVALDGERVLSVFGWRHSYDNTENKKSQPIRNNVGTKMPRQSPGCKRTSYLSTVFRQKDVLHDEKDGRVGTSRQDWKVELRVVCSHEGRGLSLKPPMDDWVLMMYQTP